jgi:type VII secretion integral membrane protein EccD
VTTAAPNRNGGVPIGAAPNGAPPAASTAGADLCRLTVVGPAGRADLAVPVSTTPGSLLPLLVRRLAAPAEGAAGPGAPGGWVLQRLGDTALDEDVPFEVLDLLDGEILHLRPADDPIPELRYDDLPVGIAASVESATHRWTPVATRRLLLGLGGAALAAAAAVALAGLPGRAVAPTGAVVAVALVLGAVLLVRRAGQRGPGLVAGFGGIAVAAGAGLCVPGGPTGVWQPGATGTVLAALGAGVAAAVLLAAWRAAAVALGSVIAVAVSVLAAAGLAVWSGLDGARALAVVAVVVFLAGAVGPRIAVRLARLRVPQLPRTAAELQDDIDPEPGSVVAARTARADALLSVLCVCSAVLAVATAVALQAGPGWADRVLPLALAAAAVLRGRILRTVVQRGALVWAAAFATGVMTTGLARDAGVDGAAVLLAVVLLAAAGALVAAWRLPGRRLLPVWGQAADLAELWTALALVPVLLQVLGLYAFFRALNG